MLAHVRRILDGASPTTQTVQVGARLLAQMATLLGELQLRSHHCAHAHKRVAE